MFGMIRVCESTFSAVNFMKSIIVVCYKCKKQPDFEHLLGNEKKNAKYLILLNIDHIRNDTILDISGQIRFLKFFCFLSL